MPDSRMSASVSEAIAMWISGGGRSRSWTLMRFWMPDCCWQLGPGPLVYSRNQEGLHREVRCLMHQGGPSLTK